MGISTRGPAADGGSHQRLRLSATLGAPPADALAIVTIVVAVAVCCGGFGEIVDQPCFRGVTPIAFRV